MRKYEDDEKVCVYCEYCDWNQNNTWCNNKRGSYYGETDYHIADTGCDKWKPCKSYIEEISEAEARSKPSYGNGYIENPWSEWKKKAYRKGLYHE